VEKKREEREERRGKRREFGSHTNNKLGTQA
jgi:hypothetical protein